MRLGSFWGITAPMLVIATKQNGMESILPMLNAVSTNKEIITDLKAELIYLLRAVDKIPKKYFPPDNFPTVENFDKSKRRSCTGNKRLERNGSCKAGSKSSGYRRSFVCGNHAFGIYALSCGRNDRVCKEKTHLGLVNRHKI